MNEAPTDHLAAARAALPKVTRVHPGASWPTLTLELDNGARIHLGEGQRASLHPVSSDGLALLAHQWGRPDQAMYTVPAALIPELDPYFPAS
jgi:hypothetical protein